MKLTKVSNLKKERIRLVNGISAVEDDFAERVIAGISEEKKTFGTLVTGK